jgi:hypothetical protein
VTEERSGERGRFLRKCRRTEHTTTHLILSYKIPQHNDDDFWILYTGPVLQPLAASMLCILRGRRVTHQISKCCR